MARKITARFELSSADADMLLDDGFDTDTYSDVAFSSQALESARHAHTRRMARMHAADDGYDCEDEY